MTNNGSKTIVQAASKKKRNFDKLGQWEPLYKDKEESDIVNYNESLTIPDKTDKGSKKHGLGQKENNFVKELNKNVPLKNLELAG